MAKETAHDLTKISLDGLRKELNDSQRNFLNLFWEYYLEHNQWPTTFDIHRNHPPTDVYECLNPLSGDIVWENTDSQGNRFELHLIGILLTKNGEAYQNMRVRLLEFLREEYFHKKKERQTNECSDEEIGRALNLNDEQRVMLGKLGSFDYVYQTYIYDSNAGGNWRIRFPTEIQYIPRTGPLLAYHDEMLLKNFNRETRVFVKDRQASFWVPKLASLSHPLAVESELPDSSYKEISSMQHKTSRNVVVTPAPDLSFVNDSNLRSFAEVIAGEACRCFDVGAFNASAVMAGSATEAALLDLLLPKKAEILAAKWSDKKKLEEWRLADLIKAAQKLQLLGDATGSLTQLIRKHRNLIHPGRALMQKTTIERGEAEIALGILRLICKELTNVKK